MRSNRGTTVMYIVDARGGVAEGYDYDAELSAALYKKVDVEALRK